MGEPFDAEKAAEQADMAREDEMYQAGDRADVQLTIESCVSIYEDLAGRFEPQAEDWCRRFKDLLVEGAELCDGYLSSEEPREGQFLSDTEADADVLRSVGWGTDEDYGGSASEVL